MYSLRSISFFAELLFPPRPFAVERLHKVHHAAFSEVHSRYANFQVLPGGGAQLSNPMGTPGAVCSAIILPDRLRVQEQMTGISRDDFEQRVQTVARVAMAELGIASFVAEQFLVQSLINPRSYENSSTFLREAVLKLDENSLEETIGREPRLVGLRLSFPGAEEGEALFNVRIESYQKDPRALFLENVGVFKVMVEEQNLSVVEELFGRTYDFLESNLVRFVSSYDSSS